MTDEEIAKVANEKANEKYPFPRVFIDIDIVRNRVYERGFIDGAKWCIEWHDLRKDPKDLPKEYKVVLNQDGDKTAYDPKRGFLGIEGIGVIAWCEIPQFINIKNQGITTSTEKDAKKNVCNCFLCKLNRGVK